MSKKLSTSNGEIVEQFRTLRTIEEALRTPTPVGSIILLDKYPVNYQNGDWKASQGEKVNGYHEHLYEKQGILLLVEEHKITAYAKISDKIYSLSRKLPWVTFIQEFIKF